MAPTISPPGIESAATSAVPDSSAEFALALSLPAVSAASLCAAPSDGALEAARFMLVGVVGTAFAIFGMIANCLLAILFLTRAHYRQSPFFFLGFVALFDTLLDGCYILLLAVPVHAEYLHDVAFIHKWINVMPLLYYLGQIFKMASTFSLIVASIERYCMTKHWTFTGFESRTRWIVLVLVVIAAVLLKIVTNEVVLIERPHCDELYRYTIGSVTRNDSTWLGIIGMASIAVPFVTLIFLNGGIVMMLRRQNVQQLRSLITQLTMGKDVMKMRRKNLRAATNTLLAIITAYLISNALNLALTMLEFVDRDFLYTDHPIAYRFAADTAGVLTAVGNAIRCPAHFVSNSEIRNQFYVLFTGEPKEEKARSALHDFAHLTGSSRRNSHKHAHTPPPRRRMGSESLQGAWFSLLLNVKNEDEESEEEMERKESIYKNEPGVNIINFVNPIMYNPWVDVARVLIPIEGAVGMILNLLLLFFLVRKDIGQAAHLYYYSCIITAILSFYTSFGILIAIDLPAIIDGNLVTIFYGPLLFYLPQWANNVFLVAFFAQVHTMWQFLPAPFIIQWLALSKFDIGNRTKMLLAYSSPVFFNLLTWIMMPNFLPSDEFRQEMAASVIRLHGTNLSQFHIYGFRTSDDSHFDGKDFALFNIIPSFLVSYALFALGAFKIRRKLVTLDASVSKRTKQMQRRFLLTQIAQVFLPLALTSIPLGVLCGAALLGEELHNFPFLMAFMMWPVPAFTALLNLGFVFKTAANKTPQQSMITKISEINQGKTSRSTTPIRI